MSTNLLAPEMVTIPAGTFLMGFPDEPFEDNSQLMIIGPRRRIEVRSFALGKYPITQEQWYEVMRVNPSPCKGRTKPVTNISWQDCQEYIERLSKMTGRIYRLPSECEWEYVAREGLEKVYPFSRAEMKDYTTSWPVGHVITPGDISTYPHAVDDVGCRSPNRWGVYDMLGLVGQHLQDCWNDDYGGAPSEQNAWMSGDCSRHVVRGSFAFQIVPRNAQLAAARIHTTGIRLACDLTQQQIFEVNTSISVTNKSIPNLPKGWKIQWSQ